MRYLTWTPGNLPQVETEAFLKALEAEADLEAPRGRCVFFIHPRDLPPPVRDLRRGHFFMTDINVERKVVYVLDWDRFGLRLTSAAVL